MEAQSKVSEADERLATWIMRDADPRTRTPFYAAVGSHSYRLGSGLLPSWLAQIPTKHLAAITEQAHRYGFPSEFDHRRA